VFIRGFLRLNQKSLTKPTQGTCNAEAKTRPFQS
jgi:hypothetical protein